MNILFRLLILIISTLPMFSCVKDTLYDTSHPAHGKVVIRADWNDRGENIDVPDKWNISLGEYSGEETSAIHSPEHLFNTGIYNLLAWTPAHGITVNGTTATASYTGNDRIGWLFTHTQEVTIEQDQNHSFVAKMRQQVRQLTIVIAPEGDAAKRISSITATLTGVASSLDFTSDLHDTPVTVNLDFRKSNDGEKWAATVCLLGMTNQTHSLNGTISFADGNPSALGFESNLSQDLATFNTDKREPLTLYGTFVSTPSQAGVTATIDKWESLDDWNVDAY